MKVLVTGAGGFIGKNLCLRLSTIDGVDLIKYDIEDSFSCLEDAIDKVDIIFHLAGVNRPESTEEFYSGNTDFTKSLVALIWDRGAKPTVVMSSSIQAALSNDYGKSKALAEEAVLSLSGQTQAYVYRLQNVFRKWCRPNYNSVVATFCYNIMHDLPIIVNDPTRSLDLVYIDDIVDEFVSLARGGVPKHQSGAYNSIEPVYSISLGELSEKLYGFKKSLQSTCVPPVGGVFTKKLFSTFLSYAEACDIVLNPKKNEDERGSFTELINTVDMGQVSVLISKKGITRGNHFHDTKMEKFIVLKGKARINLRHMITNDKMTFDVSSEDQTIVTIPVGYTHNIENLGDELILLIWANENFDPKTPDTYYEEV